ncbi:hypothetical protein BN1723_006750 [Verticillium longisporum]|uniref:Nephrocystin 3-like N-terminal domain-containing protein n=1 Tax=Verticillium longisporum TaxID=100787 RepID=A0A0G4NHA1_VERLO|nr:hypothetical protein BN1723_006750 [Verticillium longisporum]
MQKHDHGFLWMRGKAGAGKSTMMKFIYQQTKKKLRSPDTSVASFFFNARGMDLEKSISGMYRSLLVQLLEKIPDLQSVLEDTEVIPMTKQDCPGLIVLKELLQNAVMALGNRSFICFIDALDECDELQVRDMVQFFEELAESTTEDDIQFRICFSSRPYPYIEIRCGTILTLEGEIGHSEDLASYVKSRLVVENPLAEELQSRILEKASGIFMWIVLVVEILNSESNHGALALRKRLSEIPSELSKLFKRILTRDGNKPESLLLCVLWILCAKRPLSPTEFRHAMWAGLLEKGLVDEELPDNSYSEASKLVTSSSKGLAEITKAKQPTVQFIHESVRDFLVKDKGLQELWPEIGFEWEAPSHERLKNACVSYLNHPVVRAIRTQTINEDDEQAIAVPSPLSTNSIGNAETSDLTRLCFLKYASQQALSHADAAALFAPQDDYLSEFFNGTGIKWLNHFENYENRHFGKSATPLYVLADKGLERLIRARMRTESPTCAMQERFQYPFFAALAKSHKGAAAALLGLPSLICDGVDISEGINLIKDMVRYRGRTPLSWAAQEGRTKIAEALIQRGSDPNEKDTRGLRPLEIALKGKHEAVAQLLIDAGASCHSSDLFQACSRGLESLVTLLLDRCDTDVNMLDKDGNSMLITVLRAGHEGIIRLLLDKGAAMDLRNHRRSTALIEASRNGYSEAIRLLLEKGAVSIDLQNCSGNTALNKASHLQDLFSNTALIEASRNGYSEAIRLLLEKGAAIDLQNDSGVTALIDASRNGYSEAIRLLLEKGAAIDLQDIAGSTALIEACRNGHSEAVQLLLDNGAATDLQDVAGSTALKEASRVASWVIVKCLYDRGALS